MRVDVAAKYGVGGAEDGAGRGGRTHLEFFAAPAAGTLAVPARRTRRRRRRRRSRGRLPSSSSSSTPWSLRASPPSPLRSGPPPPPRGSLYRRGASQAHCTFPQPGQGFGAPPPQRSQPGHPGGHMHAGQPGHPAAAQAMATQALQEQPAKWPVTREAARETVRAAPVAASATPREATGAKASHPRRRKRQLTMSWYSVKTILALTRATRRESVFNHSLSGRLRPFECPAVHVPVEEAFVNQSERDAIGRHGPSQAKKREVTFPDGSGRTACVDIQFGHSEFIFDVLRTV